MSLFCISGVFRFVSKGCALPEVESFCGIIVRERRLAYTDGLEVAIDARSEKLAGAEVVRRWR